MGAKVTMQTIADRLGITKVSVSKALNNQPGISEQLRNRIINEADGLGYVKHKNSKKNLVVKKLGMIVPKRFFFENENFYTSIYYYMLKECTNMQIELILSVLGTTDENNNIFPFVLEKNNIDGLFLCGEVNDSYFNFVSGLDISIVAIDFYKFKMNMDCVIVDNFYASYLAANYLIENGHRDIGFIGNSYTTSSVTDRYFGYLKALNQNGLQYRKEWVLQNKDKNGFDYDYNLPEHLPTAFICHCDEAARDLVLKLHKNGIQVPEEVSVIGFDNTKFGINCEPQITTVEINKEQIAKEVLKQMLWRLKNISEQPRRVMLETKIVERSSVKKI